MVYMSFNAGQPFPLPLLPPQLNQRDPDILEGLVKAHQALGRLNGLMVATPNPLLLVTPAILQESVASSEIENIHTTMVEALEGDLFPENERRGYQDLHGDLL